MVSSTLCPVVHILGSQNLYSREEGIADHSVFYHLSHSRLPSSDHAGSSTSFPASAGSCVVLVLVRPRSPPGFELRLGNAAPQFSLSVAVQRRLRFRLSPLPHLSAPFFRLGVAFSFLLPLFLLQIDAGVSRLRRRGLSTLPRPLTASRRRHRRRRG